MNFCTSLFGYFVISTYKFMGQIMANYDDSFTTTVGAIAAFVGLTRLCWSAALDYV